MTKPQRALASELEAYAPDFMVIGAMRAGTTSLHTWLADMPNVCMPAMKETDFFVEGKTHQLGFGWYRNLFRDLDALTGEVSPNYAKRDVFEGVPERIAKANPDIRLVYVVRDPVERAVSHFVHSWHHGDLKPSESFAGSWAERHILATSRYAWQMEPWLEAFDRDQILFVDFDRLKSDPLALLQDVSSHIGAAMPDSLPERQKRNRSEDFKRLPNWWRDLRDSSIGARLRTFAPEPVVSTVRAVATFGKAAEKPPAIDQETRERFAQALAEDAARFRALSGLSLNTWSV